jgi:hypothetical protein
MSRSVQVTIPNVGTKTVLVRTVVKDPSGKSYQIASRTTTKNKSFVAPTIRFVKAGNYTVTVTIGTVKRVLTIKVSK